MLTVGHVTLRQRLPRRATLPHVTDYADDSHPLVGIEGTKDCSAKWVLIGERLSNQGLIHDGNERPVERVAVVEIASVLQGNS